MSGPHVPSVLELPDRVALGSCPPALLADGRYRLIAMGVPDPEPEKGFYYRSDHFELAKEGVPMLYPGGGYDDRDGHRVIADADDKYTDDQAHQDCDESAELHHCIAADQFPFVENLGQDAVLDRAENGGLQSQQEQHEQQQCHVVQPEAQRSQKHDDNFEQFLAPDLNGFFELVGELAKHGRKQEERQDEQQHHAMLRHLRHAAADKDGDRKTQNQADQHRDQRVQAQSNLSTFRYEFQDLLR